jgi:hypothetical protein
VNEAIRVSGEFILCGNLGFGILGFVDLFVIGPHFIQKKFKIDKKKI